MHGVFTQCIEESPFNFYGLTNQQELLVQICFQSLDIVLESKFLAQSKWQSQGYNLLTLKIAFVIKIANGDQLGGKMHVHKTCNSNLFLILNKIVYYTLFFN